MTRLWHFTNEAHLRDILKEGVIKTTEANVTMARERSRKVVWLLDVDKIDADHGLAFALVTVNGSSQLVSMDDVPREWDKRRVRIAVDLPGRAAQKWIDWSQQHATRDARQALIRTGGGYSAARHWYVSEHAIPRLRWLSIERLNDANEWERVDVPS